MSCSRSDGWASGSAAALGAPVPCDMRALPGNCAESIHSTCSRTFTNEIWVCVCVPKLQVCDESNGRVGCVHAQPRSAQRCHMCLRNLLPGLANIVHRTSAHTHIEREREASLPPHTHTQEAPSACCIGVQPCVRLRGFMRFHAVSCVEASPGRERRPPPRLPPIPRAPLLGGFANDTRVL